MSDRRRATSSSTFSRSRSPRITRRSDPAGARRAAADPAATGLTPLLRLVGLISFAILIVVLLILWVNGCREDQRKDTYRNYVEKVADYGQQSQRLGRNFNA